MINNKPFQITYYSASDKKTITRNALWTDKCRYWISKQGRMLMTYFDIDADGYRTASVVIRGVAGECILAAAKEYNPDIIAVGSRGLTGIDSFLLGSVAERVARYASCSVLIVRTHT